MQKRATASYIRVGEAMRFLQDAREGTPIHGDRWIAINMDRLGEELDELGLPVTGRALAVSGFTKFRETMQARPPDARLSAEDREALRQTMKELFTALYAESAGVFAFVTSDKRISAEKLLDAPAGCFSAGVFDALPPIAQQDFRDATRCIAFELPTSAAFHLMRGTEGVLRDFYCATIRQRRVRQLNWAPMVDHLRQRRHRPPPKALLDHLDSIRVNFRNPTQHPDKVYDIDEAQDLLSVSVDVVNRMVRARSA